MISSVELYSGESHKSTQHKKHWRTTWYFVAFALTIGFSRFALGEPCKAGYRIVRLSSFDTGAVVNGPVCVSVPVNGLRYSAFLGFQITVTPIDLTQGLVAPGAAPAPLAADSIPTLLNKMTQMMAEIKPQLDAKAVANETAITEVNKAVADITTIVSMSDTVFQAAGGTDTLLNELTNSNFKHTLTAAKSAQFETLQDFSTKLTNIQNLLQNIQLTQPGITDPSKSQLTAEISAVSAMLTEANTYLPNANETVAYSKQRQIFLLWEDRISSLKPEAFSVQRNVPCHTIGNETKTIGVTLNRTDLYPTLSGTAPTAATATSPLVSVNCPSAFSVSGGLAVSFLTTQSYGLIPTATAGTFTYGVTKTTNQSVMPIAMVHARLWTYRQIAVQTGFGVAAHTQDDSAGGTGAEYLFGLGVALFRTIYITPGWQMGRTASLSPGYHVGDTVASGVTAAPLINGYSPGFGVAITFTKP